METLNLTIRRVTSNCRSDNLSFPRNQWENELRGEMTEEGAGAAEKITCSAKDNETEAAKMTYLT